MSILIKGMEMPNRCEECFVFERCYTRGLFDPRGWCGITKSEVAIALKPDDCPLVPVPPHGRLIDADALRHSIKESIDECNKWANEVEGGEMYARVSQSLGTFVECALRVKAAPTIIPADKEEAE